MPLCMDVIRDSKWCCCVYILCGFSLLQLTYSGIDIVQSVIRRGSDEWRLLLIKGTILVQSGLMSVHYLVLGTQFDILYMLMQLLQFIIYIEVCYYFVYQTYTLLSLPFRLARALFILLVLILLYLLSFALWFIVQEVHNRDVYSCKNPIWLYMRAVGFVVVSMFFLIGIQVTKALNKLRRIHAVVDTSRERELWLLILIIFISSTVNFLNNIVNIVDPQHFCYDYFEDSEDANIVIFALVRLISIYIPILATSFVFSIFRGINSRTWSSSSVFDDSLRSISVDTFLKDTDSRFNSLEH